MIQLNPQIPVLTPKGSGWAGGIAGAVGVAQPPRVARADLRFGSGREDRRNCGYGDVRDVHAPLTLTDAHLLLGRIDPSQMPIPIDVAAAERAAAAISRAIGSLRPV